MAAKYKDAGLVVIGVHAPEFGFEKNPANVKNAVSELNIAYPIPIDSNHSIWEAFHNEYWPADYFIDAKGRIRYHHFGEGEYDKSERVIQTLLRENGATGLEESLVRITADGPEAPPSTGLSGPARWAWEHSIPPVDRLRYSITFRNRRPADGAPALSRDA